MDMLITQSNTEHVQIVLRCIHSSIQKNFQVGIGILGDTVYCWAVFKINHLVKEHFILWTAVVFFADVCFTVTRAYSEHMLQAYEVLE